MANGSFGGGSGSAAAPYLIEDAQDLAAVKNKRAAYYKLTQNINLKDCAWTPFAFAGNLDGGGHIIMNLTCGNEAMNSAGLFSALTGAVVDLGLVNARVIGKDKVGALAGVIGNTANASVTRCYVTGTVSGDSYIGGLAGYSYAAYKTVFADCHCDIAVTGKQDYIGGFIGYYHSVSRMTVEFHQCYFNGSIDSKTLITTGAFIGLDNELAVYDQCYYNVSRYNRIEEGLGRYTDEALKRLHYQEETGWNFRYVGNRPVWKYIAGNYPKLWFEDTAYFLLQQGGGYLTYDFSAQNWRRLETPVETALVSFFTQYGLADLAQVPAAELRELGGDFTVTALIVGGKHKEAVLYTQIIADQPQREKKLSFAAYKEKALSGDSLAFVGRKVQVTQEQETPCETWAVEIAAERENGISGPARHICIDSDARKSVIPEDQEINVVYKAGGNTGSEEDAIYTQRRTHQIVYTDAVDYEKIDMDIASEREKPLPPAKRTLLAHTDCNVESEPKDGCVTYETSKVLVKQDRAINVTAKGENVSKFLFSVDNGIHWLTYDALAKEWIAADLDRIIDSGLSMEQVHTKSVWNSFPCTCGSKLKYAIGIRNETYNSTHTIKQLTLDFVPNQGPLLEDYDLIINENSVTLAGMLTDRENDNIEYRILTSSFIDAGWKQIMPNAGWYSRKNHTSFSHAFTLDHFKVGDNKIKVETRDSRGKEAAFVSDFSLNTGAPQIVIPFHNDFYMNATIAHTGNRKVKFRIFINNKQVTPVEGYTEWAPSPFTFDYSWDSEDLVNQLPNEIIIEAVDELGTATKKVLKVTGGYKSLLFKDENGLYYSTDKGEILQQLDFGTVIGGLLTSVKTVYLENRTGLPLEKVKIWADNITQPVRGVRVKISTSPDFQMPQEEILVGKAMENLDVVPFYVRIESELGSESIKNKIFHIYANGEPVIEEKA